jgi:MYXO-CTERM domain-containing protein
MKISKILCSVAFLASASMAMAQFTPITVVSYNTEALPTFTNQWLQSITVGSDTYLSNNLAPGTSSSPVDTGWNATVANMADFNLQTRTTSTTSGSGAYPFNTVLFGGGNFTGFNGSLLDFFLFEAAGGGNPDDISIAPIFTDDTVGTYVNLPTTITAGGWGNTGLVMFNQQSGNTIAGIAWDITDMKDAGGNSLSSTATIKGISFGFVAGGIDPIEFLAVTPVPEPTTMALALLGLGGLALFRRRS